MWQLRCGTFRKNFSEEKGGLNEHAISDDDYSSLSNQRWDQILYTKWPVKNISHIAVVQVKKWRCDNRGLCLYIDCRQ